MPLTPSVYSSYDDSILRLRESEGKKMGKKILITDTILRDAHQSLIATRMKTEDMLPVLGLLDEVGYHSVEMWGGATFDSCMRYLNEDPWGRLRLIRRKMKKTKLQMLLRGQNILGYKHYPDDVVEEFVKKSIGNGIDVIRIFDALNDLRNLEKAVEVTRKEGGHAQLAVSYTISPVHNNDYYVKLVKSMVEMGAHSICIKDMAGLLSPYDAYDLVTRLRAITSLPIQIHTHYTSGMASMACMKAIEAGADIIDTAISPFALGTSQPATETMVAVLKGTEYDTGLDLELLKEIAEHFRKIKPKYAEFEKTSFIDTNVLSYQIPGGMLSNLMAQLAQQNATEKFGELLEEVPRVRKDMGYPPLVTPTSQIVGAQAVFNVLTGERYKVVPIEIKNYLKGFYGRPPGEVNEEVRKKVIGDEEVIQVRPADLLEPGLEQGRKEIGEYMEKEEDILSYILFPQVAKEYLKKRYIARTGIDPDLAEKNKKEFGNAVYPV